MASVALTLNVTFSVLIKECSAFVFILAGLVNSDLADFTPRHDILVGRFYYVPSITGRSAS